VSSADPAKLLRRLGDLSSSAAAAKAAVKAREEAQAKAKVADAAEAGQAGGDGEIITVTWGQEQVLLQYWHPYMQLHLWSASSLDTFSCAHVL
jgi:hypothetical protein